MTKQESNEPLHQNNFRPSEAASIFTKIKGWEKKLYHHLRRDGLPGKRRFRIGRKI